MSDGVQKKVEIVDGGVVRFVSPIGLDLNGDGQIGVTGETTARDGVRTTIGETVEFDLDADGQVDQVEWFAGDGDGILVDTTKIQGDKLDGSALLGDQGGKYNNGYDKLAQKDLNDDGQVRGEELADLALWIDDGDAKLEQGELQALADHEIESIDTAFDWVANQRGELLMQSVARDSAGNEILTEDVCELLMQSVARDSAGNEILTEDVWFAKK